MPQAWGVPDNDASPFTFHHLLHPVLDAVLSDLELPNVRHMFRPDPGMVWLDCDLAGADAQVVAWDAGDEKLKDAFRQGLKVHKQNATEMWGEAFTKLEEKSVEYAKKYYEIKRAVHGTNYGASARAVALILGWRISEAEQFQSRWFNLHPAIRDWHGNVARQLQTSRSVTNAFGFRRTYFDRIDSLLPQALAWGPQSTVGIVCSKGIIQVRERLPWVQFLLQVHDSANFQIPRDHISRLSEIRDALRVVVPYPDPLEIQWSLKTSPVSWGECRTTSWEGKVAA